MRALFSFLRRSSPEKSKPVSENNENISVTPVVEKGYPLTPALQSAFEVVTFFPKTLNLNLHLIFKLETIT